VGVFIAVGALVVVIIVGFVMFATNYLKAEPDRALILTGRKGWRSIVGAATLRIPILETTAWMSLRNMNLPNVSVENAYSLEGVPVSIEVVANTKISSEKEMLGRAIERFLGVPVESIKQVIKETIEGQLRDIIGTMTVEQLNQDRETFIKRVLEQSSAELGKMGITVDVLNIQKISDPNGYLDALGRKRTAEIIKNAEIGEAEAQKESMINTETAKREGEVVKADQEKQTSEAVKMRDVAMQQYHGETIAATATANQQQPLADAIARQGVVKEEQKVFEEKEKARKAVEAAKADANAELFRADIVVPADAQREAAILTAQGEAKAIEEVAKAEAYKIKVAGEAEGEAIKAKLLGEAEGTSNLADALNRYEEPGKLKITLDTMKVVAEVGAKTLDNVIPEKVIVFDSGGNGHGGALSRALNAGPAALAQFMEMMNDATGIDLVKAINGSKIIEEAHQADDKTFNSAPIAIAEGDDKPVEEKPVVEEETKK